MHCKKLYWRASSVYIPVAVVVRACNIYSEWVIKKKNPKKEYIDCVPEHKAISLEKMRQARVLSSFFLILLYLFSENQSTGGYYYRTGSSVGILVEPQCNDFQKCKGNICLWLRLLDYWAEGCVFKSQDQQVALSPQLLSCINDINISCCG